MVQDLNTNSVTMQAENVFLDFYVIVIAATSPELHLHMNIFNFNSQLRLGSRNHTSRDFFLVNLGEH